MKATADAVNPSGTSTAKTGYETKGFTASTENAINISGKAATDDAMVGVGHTDSSQADGTQSFLFDNALLLDVSTHLFAAHNASGSITSSGLTLLAGTEGLVGFSVTEVNNEDPSQDLSWSAVFDGNILSVSGINPALFMPISGGFFLPIADMPANDLTATVSQGALEYDVNAFASDTVIPEPSSFALLLSGCVGICCLRFLPKLAMRALEA